MAMQKNDKLYKSLCDDIVTKSEKNRMEALRNLEKSDDRKVEAYLTKIGTRQTDISYRNGYKNNQMQSNKTRDVVEAKDGSIRHKLVELDPLYF